MRVSIMDIVASEIYNKIIVSALHSINIPLDIKNKWNIFEDQLYTYKVRNLVIEEVLSCVKNDIVSRNFIA